MTTFFQSAKTDEELLKAAQRAGLTKTEFNDIVDDFNDRLGIEANNAMALQDAISKRRVELEEEIKFEKRQAYLSAAAKQQVKTVMRDQIKAGVMPLSSIRSQIEGDASSRGVKGAGNSVYGTYEGLSRAITSNLHTELKSIDTRMEKLFEDVPEFSEKVMIEMTQLRDDGFGSPGMTKDPNALKAASIFKKFLDSSVDRANLAGANIRKLAGWIPRMHDVEKMITGPEAWKEHMRNGLHIERTFGKVTEQDLEDILENVYQRMVTGVRPEMGDVDMTGPMTRMPKNLAKSLGKQRVLHFKFKSPELEVAYLKEFGQGVNILETVTRHLDTMALKSATMERLGPNPDATIASAVEEAQLMLRDSPETVLKKKAQRLRKKFPKPLEQYTALGGKIETGPDAYLAELYKVRDKELKALGNKQSLISRDSALGKSMMFLMRENSMSVNATYQAVTGNIRALNSVSKLGSAIFSQISDSLNFVNSNRILRDNNFAAAWFDSAKLYFKRHDPELQKTVLEYTGHYQRYHGYAEHEQVRLR